jgi:ERCC4-related helicase
MTYFHSKFNAFQITRQIASDSLAKLSPSLSNAAVDLNPHQLDAALFAFRSPLSRGAILADEVGLGKTIEAGIVISQLWAERKRKILIVCPTTLRKQWSQELLDKFFTSSVVFDTKEFKSRLKKGERNPLLRKDEIVICSFNFVQSREIEMLGINWDLVVIDEAHRLRNVYKSGNKIAVAIRRSMQNRPKLLLTATPLQNSLLELFGLVSFLDEHLFGDLKVFRERYMRGNLENRELRDLRLRLSPICQRTLRRQVIEYVRFTARIPITQDFTPTVDEQILYDKVSDYLQRDNLNALPASQRQLITLVLRKLLASSTFAIAGTLNALAEKLKANHHAKVFEIEETFQNDIENFNEIAEEWRDSELDSSIEIADETKLNIEVLAEIDELLSYGKLAISITHNAKGEALLQALNQGFAKLSELGANKKVVIFTESRRTQAYLLELLNANGYNGKAITINGTNTDSQSTLIYKQWVEKHLGEAILSNNKAVDLRVAIVERFRDEAEILVATEAAAEGVNLQFCSLVVNYDLPWNPQRIEQRIGRCHRYGQKHDVVVINFINRKNAADRRVFELLDEKFRLFNGVFGSSDEILGALESGVDFEKRIAEIYQSCRTNDEIETAFNALKNELDEQIQVRMSETRRDLLENFDNEVHERLRLNKTENERFLNQFENSFWNLTKFEIEQLLGNSAKFDDKNYEFEILDSASLPIETGRYRFARNLHNGEHAKAYTLNHPLAETLIQTAKLRNLTSCVIEFDHTNSTGKVGMIEPFVGKSGVLAVRNLQVESLEEENRIICAAIDEEGNVMHPDFGEKLFQIAGNVESELEISVKTEQILATQLQQLENITKLEIAERNNKFFVDEIDKLERWADDLKSELESALKNLDAEIRQLKKDAKIAADLEEKLGIHRKLKDVEGDRSRKRRSLFEAQDEIDQKKEVLISGVESRLQQTITTENIFTIRWKIV